jgi:hypothetical protein
LYSDEIVDVLRLLDYRQEYDEREGFQKIAALVDEEQVKSKSQTVSEFIMNACEELEDIEPSERNIKDICRGKVCFVPEALGSDVPLLKFQGDNYACVQSKRGGHQTKESS